MSPLEQMFEKQRNMPIEMLHKQYVYEYDTGILRLKEKTANDFTGKTKKTKASLWNRKYAGKAAGTYVKMGTCYYLKVMVDKVYFPAHQVVWAMHYGEWAYDSIDHIDGRGTNNKIENLRLGGDGVNNRNMKLNRNNKTGLHGLIIVEGKKGITFRSQIRHQDKTYTKTFKTLFDAACWRKSMELQFGFSDRHGEVK